jgi:hypothetical protein
VPGTSASEPEPFDHVSVEDGESQKGHRFCGREGGRPHGAGSPPQGPKRIRGAMKRCVASVPIFLTSLSPRNCWRRSMANGAKPRWNPSVVTRLVENRTSGCNCDDPAAGTP